MNPHSKSVYTFVYTDSLFLSQAIESKRKSGTNWWSLLDVCDPKFDSINVGLSTKETFSFFDFQRQKTKKPQNEYNEQTALHCTMVCIHFVYTKPFCPILKQIFQKSNRSFCSFRSFYDSSKKSSTTKKNKEIFYETDLIRRHRGHLEPSMFRPGCAPI